MSLSLPLFSFTRFLFCFCHSPLACCYFRHHFTKKWNDFFFFFLCTLRRLMGFCKSILLLSRLPLCCVVISFFVPSCRFFLFMLLPSTSFLSFLILFPSILPHQSIFMFPLSFSSSSSLSSIPPSLDSISEFDHGLSDISEDDDLNDETAASHSPWALSSNSSPSLSDQQSADLEHLPQNLPSSSPITSCSHTYSSELLGVEEAETRAKTRLLKLWGWFSHSGVVKYISFILCFFSMFGRNGHRCQPTRLLLAFTKKLSIFTSTVFKLISKSAGKLKSFTVKAPIFMISNMAVSRMCQIVNSLTLKLSNFFAFFTHYLPTRFTSLVLTRPHLPSVSSLTYLPVVSSFSSLSFLSALPFSVQTLSSCSRANLSASVHRYLLNPSPLFLPCLLVIFLFVVMLTASQSLVLALILATPLGLTLYYLENTVSIHRKAVLPTFVSQRLNEDKHSPLTPTHTPPRIRHHTHSNATWTQEMCDPAA